MKRGRMTAATIVSVGIGTAGALGQSGGKAKPGAKERGVMSSATTGQPAGKRTAEVTVDVKASPAVVWKALTDAEELTRWFPLEAAVKPGVGGSIVTAWGPGERWESPISIWEPERRLRTLWCPPNTPEADLFGVDFFVEDRGGGVTRMRLVHFGFSKEAKWDAMYDGVSRGWDFMAAGLKVYLEEHAGTPRRLTVMKAKLGDQSAGQAWGKVFSGDGMLPESLRGLKAGEKFSARVGGEELRGVVRKNLDGKDFQGVLESFGGGLVRIQTDPCKGAPGTELSVTLATFGEERAGVKKVREAWTEVLGRAYGKEGVEVRTK